jgi:hypothetical protein
MFTGYFQVRGGAAGHNTIIMYIYERAAFFKNIFLDSLQGVAEQGVGRKNNANCFSHFIGIQVNDVVDCVRFNL